MRGHPKPHRHPTAQHVNPGTQCPSRSDRLRRAATWSSLLFVASTQALTAQAGHQAGNSGGNLDGNLGGSLGGNLACFPTEHLSAGQVARADSMLANGLDNEALFTLFADPAEGKGHLPLKPMSSLDGRRLQVARPDSVAPGARHVVSPDHPDLSEMRDYQEILGALRCGPLQVVMTPFRIAQDGTRNLQVVVVHRDRLDDDLRKRASFWGQWGFVPGVDPATLITVVEFEEAGARFRGYGNLFGYPDHAVDFFVEAAAHQTRTGDFVERDFLQIPVHSRETGRFVYAVPMGHVTLPEDEAIRDEAARVLAAYRDLRPAFTNEDGTLRAAELLRALHATPSPTPP